GAGDDAGVVAGHGARRDGPGGALVRAADRRHQERSAGTVSEAPTLLDGFCGAGGLSLGLRRAGWRPLAAFDLDARAVASYRRNLGPHAFAADVRDVIADRLRQFAGIDRFDLVAGGPPCQGFSVQRRGGAADARNGLPAEFLRLVAEL